MHDDVRRVPGGVAVDTCSDNDTASRGSFWKWSWTNPTNQAYAPTYEGVAATSVECLWQGLKDIKGRPCPDPETLAGDWRRGKKRRPRGHWGGPNRLLITDAGEARRRIYVPAYAALIAHWMTDPVVADLVRRARVYPGIVYLRDYDTGRGLDNAGPMSHAWVLSVWLGTGEWPK